MKLFIINGPNLDMLGIREPRIYGKESYADLENYLRQSAKELGLEIEIFQSNHEGALIDEVHRAYFEKADGIIINAGGYTHTSVARSRSISSSRRSCMSSAGTCATPGGPSLGRWPPRGRSWMTTTLAP